MSDDDLEVFEAEDGQTEVGISSIVSDENSIVISGGVLQNSASMPIKNIQCYISKTFMDAMKNIEYNVVKSLGSQHEFGCFIKGFMDEDGIFKILDDIYIPKQTVTAATIDFLEDSPEGYNGVIHRHPNGCTRFSPTDDKFINSNFEFSLLYESNTVRQAIINILIDENSHRLQVPMTPMFETKFQITPIDVSMIQKKVAASVMPFSGSKVPKVPKLPKQDVLFEHDMMYDWMDF